MEVALIFFLLVLFPSTLLQSNSKVDALIPATSSIDDPLKEYVYDVELSLDPGNKPWVFSIKLLTSVLGSEKAAKKAYLWNYDDSNFSAHLTREQAKRLEELHNVESVTEKKEYFPPQVDDLRTINFAPQ